MDAIRIGLIGDFDPQVVAHQAIPLALQSVGEATATRIALEWLATEQLSGATEFNRFDALWCTPGSPYRSTTGALFAIRYARENNVPFLGTCGGFQHALLEYALNVLGWSDAEHAETASHAERLVIAPLSCALVEANQTLTLRLGSRLARSYASHTTTETYRCRFGLNRQYESALLQPPLIACAHDSVGEIRAVELANHPFFVATLFQPERAALQNEPVPLAHALIAACRAP